jgi:hypothetical protein
MIVSNASSETHDLELRHPAKSTITIDIPFLLETGEKIRPQRRHTDALIPILVVRRQMIWNMRAA